MDDILMPRITETMRDGVLLRWLAPDGATISEGELIAEVAVEDRVEALESPASGELLHGVAEGTEVGVGEPIGIVGRPAGPVQMGMFGAEPVTHDAPPVSAPARRAAEELGVDLATVVGSGPGGRISRADVEAAAARLGAPATPTAEGPEPEPEPEPDPEPEPEPDAVPDADAASTPPAAPASDAGTDPVAEEAASPPEPPTETEPHGATPPDHAAEDAADEDDAPADDAVPAPPAQAHPAARAPLTLVPEVAGRGPRYVPTLPAAVPAPAGGEPATRPVLERDVEVTELLRLRDALAAAADGGGPGLDALVVRAIALAGDAATVAVRTGDGAPVVVPGADELSVGAIAAAILDGDEGDAPVTLLDLSGGGADRVAPAPGDGLVIAIGRVQRRPVVREHSVVPGRMVTLTLTPAPGAGWDRAAGLLDRVAALLERPHALVL